MSVFGLIFEINHILGNIFLFTIRRNNRNVKLVHKKSLLKYGLICMISAQDCTENGVLVIYQLYIFYFRYAIIQNYLTLTRLHIKRRIYRFDLNN